MTGVQTCALPIFDKRDGTNFLKFKPDASNWSGSADEKKAPVETGATIVEIYFPRKSQI